MSPPSDTEGIELPVEVPADKAGLVVTSQLYPEQLPVLTLPGRPLFPKTVVPLVIVEPSMLKLVSAALESSKRLLAVVLTDRPQLSDDDDVPPPSVPSIEVPKKGRIGVIAQVLRAERSDNGLQLMVGGLDRLRIEQIVQSDPFVVANVSYIQEPKSEQSDELRALSLAAINSIRDLVQLNPLFKEELSLLVKQGGFEEPGRLADLAAFLTSARGPVLQEVLETLPLKPRLERVLELLQKELDISRLQQKIRKQIDERVSRQQREFFLREQLKAIKKELGLEKDDKEAEIKRYRERLEFRELSEEATRKIEDEIGKIELLDASSAEYNLTRNYLDWLTILPWGLHSDPEISLPGARAALEKSHHGLDDVKERIVEFIAAGLLRRNFGGSIVCLVGPPGVGKTSIGKSIAAALGREFYRFSLGGMRDEAEIKGHRRTYVGAMPGKFIQALRDCGTDNPVLMLDEIDKIGSSYQGDPAAALLEALDSEQNQEFLDHYLDVRFDLSNVLFVCTANQLDTIPGPLLDRMEVIQLSGYILEEKLEIAVRHLIPRELRSLGLKRSQFKFTRTAVREVIDGYAREAGVRNLDRQLKKIMRKSAVRFLEEQPTSVKIGPDDVEKLLGRRVFSESQLYSSPIPGVIMGLAWTSMGGDTLFIEARALRSSAPGLEQTGQLGQVMVESSRIAYTYVRGLLEGDPQLDGFFRDHSVHLHVPAGAVPKDGPSAGITMASALYTLAHGRPIASGFAMTGELNLSGHVMPVGGIKEKVIAARRAKVKRLVLPAANQGDFERLPGHIQKGITAHFASHFDDVVDLCLKPRRKTRSG